MTDATELQTDDASLHVVVAAYLDAREARAYADALATFASDARVVDDGGTHDGTAQIAGWIEGSSTTFEYTTTRLGHRVDGGDVVVHVRLDGTFPGGTVTLRQRFTVVDGRIAHLHIAP